MGFNPLICARLFERMIQRKTHRKGFFYCFYYQVLAFFNVPVKMRILNNRISEYQFKLEKIEQVINNSPDYPVKGKKLNKFR